MTLVEILRMTRRGLVNGLVEDLGAGQRRITDHLGEEFEYDSMRNRGQRGHESGMMRTCG